MLCLSRVLSVQQLRVLSLWNGFLPPLQYSVPLSSFQNLMETSLLWEAVPVQLPSPLIPLTPPPALSHLPLRTQLWRLPSFWKLIGRLVCAFLDVPQTLWPESRGGGVGWNILDRPSESQPIGQPTILVSTCSFPNLYNHHHLKHLVSYFRFLRRKVKIKNRFCYGMNCVLQKIC